MTAVGLLVLGAGITLIYCGVKGEDPRDVIRETLSGRRSDASVKGTFGKRPTQPVPNNITPIGE